MFDRLFKNWASCPSAHAEWIKEMNRLERDVAPTAPPPGRSAPTPYDPSSGAAFAMIPVTRVLP